jgi:hypothetical protein
MIDAADDLRQEVSRAMQDEGPLLEALKTQLDRVREFVLSGGPKSLEAPPATHAGSVRRP